VTPPVASEKPSRLSKSNLLRKESEVDLDEGEPEPEPTLQDFTVECGLGTGGFAAVVLVEHNRTGKVRVLAACPLSPPAPLLSSCAA
jgi:hypothetical protein